MERLNHPAIHFLDRSNAVVRISTMAGLSLLIRRRTLLVDRFEPRDSRVLVTRNAVSIAQNGVWIAVVAATAKALFFGSSLIQILRHRFAPFFEIEE